ncbi:MAG: DEAD/DEAH box helicase family protein [Azoarcus sp.]|jgi:hypothetical protein|nr:DEAD/DEAH box helicase family protein [Azoarcus sp.]
MIDTTQLVRELTYQIRLGEDSAYEFKSVTVKGKKVEAPGRDSTADELAAFANASGGCLVLGVDDRIDVIRPQYPTVEKFERAFPSLCFALATGVGKTRLMGAIIAWLYITGRSRHFFVLAPNLTIYEKLKKDFMPGSPKYVFTGIPELANNPPVLITGEDYEDGRGVRLDIAATKQASGELFTDDAASPHINIFNIAKINARENKKGAANGGSRRFWRAIRMF